MRYENAVRFCLQTARPFEQSFLICVAAHARELDDVRVHMNLFLEQFHFLRASDQRPSQCTDGLIADEENRTLLPPEVVLQMMLDSSCIAHAARGYDDLRGFVEVDGFRLIGCNREL